MSNLIEKAEIQSFIPPSVPDEHSQLKETIPAESCQDTIVFDDLNYCPNCKSDEITKNKWVYIKGIFRQTCTNKSIEGKYPVYGYQCNECKCMFFTNRTTKKIQFINFEGEHVDSDGEPIYKKTLTYKSIKLNIIVTIFNIITCYLAIMFRA